MAGINKQAKKHTPYFRIQNAVLLLNYHSNCNETQESRARRAARKPVSANSAVTKTPQLAAAPPREFRLVANSAYAVYGKATNGI